eukprot:m.12730 g.12730  ORF g.12730 m.12730 type:complete len:399 (-) comp9419_c0_seq1:95-1291(-)
MAGPSNPNIEDATYLRMSHEGKPTNSSREQSRIEDSIAEIWEEQSLLKIAPLEKLNRELHITYLKKGLLAMPQSFTCLDASRPWLVYWIIHSLDLLGVQLSSEEQSSCLTLLSRCQSPEGGFAGGPGQLAHLAPTYAAVNSLAIIGTEEAYKIIDRRKLITWLRKLREPSGGWQMHEDGELDVRGAYCAASTCVLLGVPTAELFENTAEWVVRCQTFDGGISAVPSTEAHGGYAFCGLAAVDLLGLGHKLNLPLLLSWTTSRQMRFEGGFQGRPNKLVDGCYSFWVGGVFPLLSKLLFTDNEQKQKQIQPHELCSWAALSDYILYCCQDIRGGLRDKPEKSRDYYHTCYCLSGLSSAQSSGNETFEGDDKLRATHPQHNICIDKADAMKKYFQAQALE